MSDSPTANRWAIILASVEAIASLVLLLLFWRMHRNFHHWFYVTHLGLAVYVGILCCSLALLLALLYAFVRIGHSPQRIPTFLLLMLAFVPIFSLLVKWVPTFFGPISDDWFALFHNRMGLGMEILGPIPNMILDGLLFVATLGPFLAILGIPTEEPSSHPGREASQDSPKR